MNVLARVVSVPEAVLGVVMAALPLLFVGTFFLWVVRLVTTLRERLDAIEDKLELLLLAQQIKSSSAKEAPSKSESQIEKPSP